MFECGARAQRSPRGVSDQLASKLGRGVCLVLLLAAAGCAKNPSPMDSAQWRVAGPIHQLPRAHVVPDPSLRRVIEDDGLEEQPPPLVNKHKPIIDDPSEPFSPNYGSEPVRQGMMKPLAADVTRVSDTRGGATRPASVRPLLGEGWVTRAVRSDGRSS
ncbi:MAG: hypothetical protein AAFV45_04520 [Pseudomonadota bacterium]